MRWTAKRDRPAPPPAPVSIHRSLATPESIADAIKIHHGISSVKPPRLLLSGVNDHYLIEGRRGHRYAARLYLHMRDPAAVQAEHAFIDHLADRGVGAARALRGLDGSSLYTYPAPEGDRILTLFEWAPGRVQIGKPKTRSERRQRNKQSRFYGAAVARMHTAADEFPADRLPVIDLRTSVIEGANYLNSFLTSGHDRRRLRKAANAALRMAKQIQSDPFDNGPCHGDDHAGNGTIDGKTVTLYDFDLCGVAPRAFDLATYRWSNEVQSKHEDEGWKNFIAGYRSVRALPDREVMAAQMLLPVRHFWFMQILSNYEGHWNGIASFMNGDRPHKDLDRLDAWTKQVASLDPSFGRELSK